MAIALQNINKLSNSRAEVPALNSKNINIIIIIGEVT